MGLNCETVFYEDVSNVGREEKYWDVGGERKPVGISDVLQKTCNLGILLLLLQKKSILKGYFLSKVA